jgi:hypothetical protein
MQSRPALRLGVVVEGLHFRYCAGALFSFLALVCDLRGFCFPSRPLDFAVLLCLKSGAKAIGAQGFSEHSLENFRRQFWRRKDPPDRSYAELILI